MKKIILFLFIYLTSIVFTYPVTPEDATKAKIFKDLNEGEYYREQNQTLSPNQLQKKAEGLKQAFNAIKASDPKAKIYVIVNGQSISPLVSFEILQGGMVLIGMKHGSKVSQQTVSAGDIEKLGQW